MEKEIVATLTEARVFIEQWRKGSLITSGHIALRSFCYSKSGGTGEKEFLIGNKEYIL